MPKAPCHLHSTCLHIACVPWIGVVMDARTKEAMIFQSSAIPVIRSFIKAEVKLRQKVLMVGGVRKLPQVLLIPVKMKALVLRQILTNSTATVSTTTLVTMYQLSTIII